MIVDLLAHRPLPAGPSHRVHGDGRDGRAGVVKGVERVLRAVREINMDIVSLARNIPTLFARRMKGLKVADRVKHRIFSKICFY